MAGHRVIESDRLCKEQERARADKLRISWVACEGSSPMVMHLGDSHHCLDFGWDRSMKGLTLSGEEIKAMKTALEKL